MNVTVLFGGPSAEREVSLVSGRSVIDGLKAAGHEVFASDISPSNLSALERPCDVIFPVLHGAFGESGELQEILESRGIPFVGSGSAASRAGMDKDKTKRVWLEQGLPTAQHELMVSEIDIAGAIERIGTPCVIKPINSGSSLGVCICKTVEQAKAAASQIIADHGVAMIEQFVKGKELTVGILGERALSPIRITTSHEFFDYAAKYKGNDAQHHFDLELDSAVVKRVQKLALQAHQALGCRDLSRLDVIIDGNDQPWLLEINTMPGFTPKSLLPEMAAHDGVPFSMLVDRLVKTAAARGAMQQRIAV